MSGVLYPTLLFRDSGPSPRASESGSLEGSGQRVPQGKILGTSVVKHTSFLPTYHWPEFRHVKLFEQGNIKKGSIIVYPDRKGNAVW